MHQRKKSRDSVLKLIFEYLFSGEYNEKTLLIMTTGEMPMSEVDYITTVYKGVIKHFDELKEIITKYARGYDFDRIYRG